MAAVSILINVPLEYLGMAEISHLITDGGGTLWKAMARKDLRLCSPHYARSRQGPEGRGGGEVPPP